MTTAVPEVRIWVSGTEQPVTEADWGQRVLTSLGCSFRVTVPAGREDDDAWWWARDRAREVADRFGARFDPEPWRRPGAPQLGWEVHGLWEHRFRAPLGEPTTRLTALRSTDEPERQSARAVVLPFPYGSRAALAGHPVPLPHLERLAAQHLMPRDADVGLWVDHAGELCTSTVGPLLVRTDDGSWLHPRAESGLVPTWTWLQLVESRSSRPTLLRVTDLAGAGTYAAAPSGQVVELFI